MSLKKWYKEREEIFEKSVRDLMNKDSKLSRYDAEDYVGEEFTSDDSVYKLEISTMQDVFSEISELQSWLIEEKFDFWNNDMGGEYIPHWNFKVIIAGDIKEFNSSGNINELLDYITSNVNFFKAKILESYGSYRMIKNNSLIVEKEVEIYCEPIKR